MSTDGTPAETPRASRPESRRDGQDRPLYEAGVLGHGRHGERERLRLLEQLSDPTAIGIFEELGIEADWCCVEVGAGSGSIAQWLASRCPQGHVVATDLDIGLLQGMPTRANLTTLRHDVTRDDFPARSQNLVHARAVLTHLPAPDKVLGRMTSWLAPGGWVVIEDPTYMPPEISPYPEFASLLRGCERLLEQTQGTDSSWARRVPAAMAACGLTGIQMSVRVGVCGNGDKEDDFWRLCFARTAPALIETGLMTAREIEKGIAHLDRPGFNDVAWMVISCWGQLPYPL
ncbi:class I SAM-dependent methyltransferase [Streptomyces sp. NPDC014727]|uniref:class I SAM-dependent methyltransferase n=1 Tax=Streptomyces sp. NPDC014727 TaxID=3364883 RepID=UPI0036FBD320